MILLKNNPKFFFANKNNPKYRKIQLIKGQNGRISQKGKVRTLFASLLDKKLTNALQNKSSASMQVRFTVGKILNKKLVIKELFFDYQSLFLLKL